MIKKIYYKIIRILYDKILKKRIIFNQKKYCKKIVGSALLYYKIDPFIDSFSTEKYIHTNFQEILEIVKILNKKGYVVDIIDRKITSKDIDKLKPDYNLFIGLGAGNSGRFFAEIAKRYPSAIKILYAAGAEPEFSNQLILKRYEYFEKRNNKKLKIYRVSDKINFKEFVRYTDAFFVIGNKFAIDSYKKFNKPIYQVFPSTSPNISFYKEPFPERKKNFLYFGGNGNIVKGLDLLIEVFSQLSDFNLHICAPNNEKDFFNFYRSLLDNSPNIIYHGFIEPGKKKFNEISKQCGYVILPSSKEGIATSVATCMRRGLIPVVTYETGIDIENFGFLLKDIKINYLKQKIIDISNISTKEFDYRINKTYQASNKYTIDNFINTFSNSLNAVLTHYNF